LLYSFLHVATSPAPRTNRVQAFAPQLPVDFHVCFEATGLLASLSANTSTGLISGNPTAAGTSTVTLSATNAGGTDNATLTLTIAAVIGAPLQGRGGGNAGTQRPQRRRTTAGRCRW
jgi:hypothetical protein